MIAGVAVVLCSMQSKSLAESVAAGGAEAVASVRKSFPAEELQRGASPREIGRTFVFAIESTGRSASVVFNESEEIVLNPLGEGVFAAVKTLPDGFGDIGLYKIDGKTVGSALQIEAYGPNPLATLRPALKGELRDMGTLGSSVFPGTTRKWWVYLPPASLRTEHMCLLVGQDAQWDKDWMTAFLENMAVSGAIRPTVGVFIEPGSTEGKVRDNRSFEYDTLSGDYARFLETEVLPKVKALASISDKPEDRAITGMSSGGICSFTACWERPDLFQTAISFVGSFQDIRGGHAYPFMVRKRERKDIRVFLQDGKNDLDNTYGNWWLGNQQMKEALEFKGYDLVWVPGNGFHNTKHARAVFDKALTWWQKR